MHKNDQLLERHKIIRTKIEKLKGLKLSSLSIYDNKYIKTKIRTYNNIFYTDFHELGVSEDDTQCDCLLVIPIDSLFVWKKKRYLKRHFDECLYKIVNKQMMMHLDYFLQLDSCLMKISLSFFNFDKVSCKYRLITNLISQMLR